MKEYFFILNIFRELIILSPPKTVIDIRLRQMTQNIIFGLMEYRAGFDTKS